MPYKCPQCGAMISDGVQCRDRFDQCLALEYELPAAFGKVHFLTVACYMLQHNAYSREAWLEARDMVAQLIRQEIPPAGIRKENRQRLDNGHRTWSITKGAKLSEFDRIVWSRTIADVRFDSPENYCTDIESWAKSLLEDTDAALQAIRGK